MFPSMGNLLNLNKYHAEYLRDHVLDLLFLLYINDLPNVSDVLHFYLFADDTKINYEAETRKNWRQ